MKKINLTEANKLLKKPYKDNVFSAFVHKSETKSINKLNFYKKLIVAIKTAEKASGIDNLKAKLKSLELDLEYYNPLNKSLYYKDGIPDILIDTVTDKHKELLEEYRLLNLVIQEKSNDVFIEV
jgi:hypothetical protein